MRRSVQHFTAGLVGLVVLAASGCGVQQDRYDALLQTERSLREENIRLADELQAAESNAQSMSRELANARGQMRGLEDRNARLGSEIDSVSGEYDSLLARVSSLDMGPLPPDVEADLQRLASEYPQLMTFDARRGMLRFSSDFTFALGSTELRQDAVTTLAMLAEILNKPSASSLEVQVVGHTDNVPIGKPETRQKHPTNLHLSVHRAIAVQDALVDRNVDAARIQVAGYGSYRPIVANGRNGAEANRRVEIFLVPMRGAMPSGPDNASEVRVPTDEPMK